MANAPQRVLMTADAVGGVWTYAMELASGLSAQGVTVGIAVMGGISMERRCEAVAIPGVTLFWSDYRLEWMPDPWGDVERAGAWLLGIAECFNPDVIHLNGFAHAALNWNAPVLVVAHSCVCSWWRAVKSEAAPSSWSRYHDAVLNGLEHADCVAAPTSTMAAALKQEYGLRAECQVIPNGRRPPQEICGMKQPFVLSAGRFWDEAKNIVTLSRAAETSNLQIYVAGDIAVDANDASANVHRLGKLTSAELAGWYSRAAIYAGPALYEPFGYAPLEAAQAGCALVLSDIPSLREVWGDAALFVNPRDAAAWRETLEALLDDQAATEQWGERARRRAELYRADLMTGRYLELYRQLLQGPSECGSSSSRTLYARTGTTETHTSSAA